VVWDRRTHVPPFARSVYFLPRVYVLIVRAA
jgi:hypothetical protein